MPPDYNFNERKIISRKRVRTLGRSMDAYQDESILYEAICLFCPFSKLDIDFQPLYSSRDYVIRVPTDKISSLCIALENLGIVYMKIDADRQKAALHSMVPVSNTSWRILFHF